MSSRFHEGVENRKIPHSQRRREEQKVNIVMWAWWEN